MVNEGKQEMNLFSFLILIWQKLKKTAKKCLIYFIKTIRLSYQYKWVMFIFIILGIGFGYYNVKKANKLYKAETIITFPEGLRLPVTKNIFNFFIADKGSIKKILNENNATFPTVKKIEIYNVIDSKNDFIPDYIDYKNKTSFSDTTNVIMQDRICLMIKVKGKYDYDTLQKQMGQYLNNLPQLKKLDEIYRTVSQQKMQLLNKEVARIDSLSTYDYFIKPSQLNLQSDKTLLITEREQKIFTDDLLNIENKRDMLQKQIASTNGIISFETPFIVMSTPPYIKLLLGLFTGLILGLIISLLIKYWKQITRFLNEK